MESARAGACLGLRVSAGIGSALERRADAPMAGAQGYAPAAAHRAQMP